VKVVRRGPVLDDLALFDAADHDAPDPDWTAAVVALGRPARSDALALADLILDADLQIAVAEDELVERERLPDPLVPVVLARIDVVVEGGAVHTDGGGRVAARADPLQCVTSQLPSVIRSADHPAR